MTPHELNRLKEAYAQEVMMLDINRKAIKSIEQSISQKREQLIKYHITELTSLGITSQELQELLVQTKLEQE